jgi:AhpD family alkylhydroperoxidase
MILPLGIIVTGAEILFGLLLLVGWHTRAAALLSGLFLLTFRLAMSLALGVKAPLNFAVLTGDRRALLLANCQSFPFSVVNCCPVEPDESSELYDFGSPNLIYKMMTCLSQTRGRTIAAPPSDDFQRDKTMQARLEAQKVSPARYQAMLGLEISVRKQSKSEPALLQVVKMRASQINGCAYCLDMHSKDVRAESETEQRLYALSAWEEKLDPSLAKIASYH